MSKGISLDEFVRNIASFGSWSFPDKIAFFAWYLQKHGGKTRVKPADLNACFDEIHLRRPASLGPYVKRLTEGKNPKLLRDADGYRLERAAFDSVERKYGERESTVAVLASLAALPAKVPGAQERDYLNEVLICFKNRAFRAAIVMAWNLAYSHFLRWLLADSSRLSRFNTQIAKTAPEVKLPSGIATFDDFTFVKEDKVLQSAKSVALITTNLHKAMKAKLELRNSYAHPSSLVVTQLTAEEAIQSLIDNVVLKLQ